MNRLDILKKIDENGGSWSPAEKICFEPYQYGAEMDAVLTKVKLDVDAEVQLRLWNHIDDVSYFSLVGTDNLRYAYRNYRAFEMLAVAVDYKIEGGNVPDVVVKTVEKEVDRTDHVAQARMTGKIEAYENILIGRNISVSA